MIVVILPLKGSKEILMIKKLQEILDLISVVRSIYWLVK